MPPRLSLSARQLLNSMIITWYRFLHCLRLWPRGHPIEQDLFERPHVIGQPSRHRWGPGLPQLGRPVAIGGNWFGQSLA